MLASERILKLLNSLLSRKYFRGKWRIENLIVALIKARTDYYLHPLSFWWKIEDKSTMKTFLVNCENSTSAIICRLLENERIIFVDIGANLGWYTLLVKSLNSNSKIFAFEPMNSVREKLFQNLRQNGFDDVRVESCALGSSSDIARLWSYSDNNGMHTLYPVKDWGAASGQEVRIEELNSYRDQFSQEELPILLKLDCEGSEMEVLKGATSVLEVNNTQIIMEINETMLETAGTSVEELFALLRSFGFIGFWITPDMKLLSQSLQNSLPHRDKLPSFEGANYFFTKNVEKIANKIQII
jgi:FkbM family methyltransferase